MATETENLESLVNRRYKHGFITDIDSEGLPPGEFDRIMEAAGGVNNAYTNSDVTVYTDWFPRTALETIFMIEADRFARLEFVPELVEVREIR